MIDVTAEIDDYLHRLFPLCRSLTGEPNRKTLRIIQEIVPLSIHEVSSGTEIYDWVVPDEWTVRDAYIVNSRGIRVVDFKNNNLHLMSYSVPIHSTMCWDELRSHIHKHDQLPDAIPYRTSYYQRDWGFCVTGAQYEELANETEPLTVRIDTDLKKGSLSYGEYLLPGGSNQEILISCYICHPSMANDSLSGVLLTAFLARELTKSKNRKWSYRFIFVPETIGAITYCAMNEAAMKKIDVGLVVTTVGGPGAYGYKQSFEKMHPINKLIEEVFNESKLTFVTYPFDIHGSDERQYSSQGFRINTATISRDRYYEYSFYHTSLDNLLFVSASRINSTLSLYWQLVRKLESRCIYRNRVPFCEVMLSRHDLYPATGGAQRPNNKCESDLDLVLWLLHYCDGKEDIATIARRLETPLKSLEPTLELLVAKNILEQV